MESLSKVYFNIYFMQYLKEYNDYSFEKWFEGSKIVDENGNPKIVYHQTNKEDSISILKNGFDINKGRARLSDELVPNGFFFKDTDINIETSEDNTQLKFYLSIKNPLITTARDTLKYKLINLSSTFKEMYYTHEEIDKEFKNKFDEMYHKWTRDNRDEMGKELEILLDEWNKWQREYSNEMRNEINKILKRKRYDGVIIERDEGSFGRVTKTIIALDNSQIKPV